MRLVSFTVRNYRSIVSSSKIHLRDSATALIGPNNEGKSNVLRALVVALEIASRLDRFTLGRYGRLSQYRGGDDRYYRWETDFPLSLQADSPEGRSEFSLEFDLTPQEVTAFTEETGSSLNGTLPIAIKVGRGEPAFQVVKKGPGAKALSAKAAKIAAFLGKRIDFVYIPALRPASIATKVVEATVTRELQALSADPEYQKALERIQELQAPILRRISESVRDTLKVFLPKVKAVDITISDGARELAWTRACEVSVDDGFPTELSKKGDGVQSLAALGLLRHASQSKASEKQLILAIEEPESHLHSSAIHQLRGVLSEIAAQHQIIITTHCPLFVDRRDISANILVANNQALRARTIGQIRDILGVRVSDNLTAAEVVLFVEGEDDRRAICALLESNSTTLKSALSNGLVAVDSLAGGTNLSYKLGAARDSICTPHALMDHDPSGKMGVQKAISNALITMADVTFTSAVGMRESELEDWYNPRIYADSLAEKFGVPNTDPLYTATNKKWSVRMRELFMKHGKGWGEDTELQVKQLVSEAIAASPAQALLPIRKPAFDALVSSLEGKLST